MNATTEHGTTAIARDAVQSYQPATARGQAQQIDRQANAAIQRSIQRMGGAS